MTNKLLGLFNKLLLMIVACTASACAAPAKLIFSNGFFSTEFPDGFKIEENDSGTILAFDELSESTFIINYENTTHQTSTESCEKMGRDFFSKVQEKSDAQKKYFDFIVKRKKKLIGHENGFVSLGYYCKKNKIIYISFIYMHSSEKSDAPFMQVIEKIHVK